MKCMEVVRVVSEHRPSAVFWTRTEAQINGELRHSDSIDDLGSKCGEILTRSSVWCDVLQVFLVVGVIALVQGGSHPPNDEL